MIYFTAGLFKCESTLRFRSLHSLLALKYYPTSSNEVFVRVEIVIISGCISNNVIQFDFVPQKSANSTETLAELVSVRALVRDELNVDSIFLVVKTEPVGELLAGYDL